MKKNYLFLGLILILFMPIIVSAKPTLSQLNVAGIGDLNVNRQTYYLSLTSTYDYVIIKAVPSDSSYTVTGDGKVNLTTGNNKVIVSVANNSGEKTDYILNINFNQNNTNSSDNPNTGAFLNISVISVLTILVVLVIIKIRSKNKFYKV